jgi:mannose-6-phosphate isomerase-like protein (cupin superfamily)
MTLLRRVSVLAASLAAGAALAQEGPIARSAGDPQLKWGGCPEFLPKGCQLAVLHGDPAKPNADVFLKVPGGSKLARHWHTSAERMVLVAGEMHVTYDGHKPVVLKAGSYAYGPAKLPHSAECKGKAACVLFIAFESPVDAVPNEAAGGKADAAAPKKDAAPATKK